MRVTRRVATRTANSDPPGTSALAMTVRRAAGSVIPRWAMILAAKEVWA
jgi:hypothetical protein